MGTDFEDIAVIEFCPVMHSVRLVQLCRLLFKLINKACFFNTNVLKISKQSFDILDRNIHSKIRIKLEILILV